MSTAEDLAFSISEEGRGIHILLWDDQEDLVHALIILYASLKKRVTPLLVSSGNQDLRRLKTLMESRISTAFPKEQHDNRGDTFWMLFIQQANSREIGPRMNGWRKPLAEAPGSLLLIRHADFDTFQRHAPDLVSFVGPRIYSASNMLSIFSDKTYQNMDVDLFDPLPAILRHLPGEQPGKEGILEWIEAYAPTGRETSV